MKNALKIAFAILFCCCSFILQAQDTPTPKDAVDFIRNIGKQYDHDRGPDAGSDNLMNFNLIDGKLYIMSLHVIPGPYHTFYLYVINLSRVRIKGNQIYADNKEDILETNMSEVPSRFWNFKTAKEQYDFFIKKSRIGLTPFGFYNIDDDFIPPNESGGRYKDENYYERVVKAFDFLIRYFGGGKVLGDPNSKF